MRWPQGGPTSPFTETWVPPGAPSEEPQRARVSRQSSRRKRSARSATRAGTSLASEWRAPGMTWSRAREEAHEALDTDPHVEAVIAISPEEKRRLADRGRDAEEALLELRDSEVEVHSHEAFVADLGVIREGLAQGLLAAGPGGARTRSETGSRAWARRARGCGWRGGIRRVEGTDPTRTRAPTRRSCGSDRARGARGGARGCRRGCRPRRALHAPLRRRGSRGGRPRRAPACTGDPASPSIRSRGDPARGRGDGERAGRRCRRILRGATTGRGSGAPWARAPTMARWGRRRCNGRGGRPR